MESTSVPLSTEPRGTDVDNEREAMEEGKGGQRGKAQTGAAVRKGQKARGNGMGWVGYQITNARLPVTSAWLQVTKLWLRVTSDWLSMTSAW